MFEAAAGESGRRGKFEFSDVVGSGQGSVGEFGHEAVKAGEGGEFEPEETK